MPLQICIDYANWGDIPQRGSTPIVLRRPTGCIGAKTHRESGVRVTIDAARTSVGQGGSGSPNEPSYSILLGGGVIWKFKLVSLMNPKQGTSNAERKYC